MRDGHSQKVSDVKISCSLFYERLRALLSPTWDRHHTVPQREHLLPTAVAGESRPFLDEKPSRMYKAGGNNNPTDTLPTMKKSYQQSLWAKLSIGPRWKVRIKACLCICLLVLPKNIMTLAIYTSMETSTRSSTNVTDVANMTVEEVEEYQDLTVSFRIPLQLLWFFSRLILAFAFLLVLEWLLNTN